MIYRQLQCGHCLNCTAEACCQRCGQPRCPSCLIDGLCLPCFRQQSGARASPFLLLVQLAGGVLFAVGGLLSHWGLTLSNWGGRHRPRRLRRLLMITGAIAGILLALAIAHHVQRSDRPFRQRAAAAVMHNIQVALEHYQLEQQDSCPANLQKLVESGILVSLPKDPWGQAYLHRCPGLDGTALQVLSAGPDGQFGSADDLCLSPH